MADFYSVYELKKPEAERRYHNNDRCVIAGKIPRAERQGRTGGYQLCEECQRLHN
ncbi:MAG TPA: hypothetical protein VIG86_09380 [Candidatus Dormibacteraeota bacterium]